MLVAESGIHHRADVERLGRAGAGADIDWRIADEEPRRHCRQNFPTAQSLIVDVLQCGQAGFHFLLDGGGAGQGVGLGFAPEGGQVVLRAAMTSPLRSRSGWVTST